MIRVTVSVEIQFPPWRLEFLSLHMVYRTVWNAIFLRILSNRIGEECSNEVTVSSQSGVMKSPSNFSLILALAFQKKRVQEGIPIYTLFLATFYWTYLVEIIWRLQESEYT